MKPPITKAVVPHRLGRVRFGRRDWWATPYWLCSPATELGSALDEWLGTERQWWDLSKITQPVPIAEGTGAPPDRMKANGLLALDGSQPAIRRTGALCHRNAGELAVYSHASWVSLVSAAFADALLDPHHSVRIRKAAFGLNARGHIKTIVMPIHAPGVLGHLETSA